MNAPAITLNGTPAAHRSLANPLLWLVFLVYVVVLGYAGAHHQLWGDEINAWNIAKASGSFSDLLRNPRYEGHPPGWHFVLWIISKCTNDLVYVQVVHSAIAAGVVFILLFFSPLPVAAKMLIPFGYYFLFEYAVLDRNYAMGVLAAFCICIALQSDFKYKMPLYYALLFFISGTHLLGVVLGGSLHLYFLLLNIERGKKKSVLALHLFAGLLVFLPSLYFIFPPPDSVLGMHSWADRWSVHQLPATINMPVQAFLPVPAWWKYHCWNTQFLLEEKDKYTLLKLVCPLVSAGLLALVFFILRKSRKSLALFTANLLVTFLISATVFPLMHARYTGFIFIGFITAWWLYCYEMTPVRDNRAAVYMLLVVQLIAGVFFVVKTARQPFSNLYRVKDLIKEVPANERLVTDYWTLNTVLAYTDRPAYCVDLQKEVTFVTWGTDMKVVHDTPNRYTLGMKALFQRSGPGTIYFVSMASPQLLTETDSLLQRSFQVQLIDKTADAIEKGSNLYLYRVNDVGQ